MLALANSWNIGGNWDKLVNHCDSLSGSSTWRAVLAVFSLRPVGECGGGGGEHLALAASAQHWTNIIL